MTHPAAAGIDSRHNAFGLDRPLALQVGWTAAPLVVGRWAWGVPSGDAARRGDLRYEAGDMLGDLVLAAQQRVGSGHVVVLGDTSCLSDERLTASYPFVARLLGALAAKSGSPQDLWRQMLGLLAAAGLIGMLAWRADAMRIALAVVALAVSLAATVGMKQSAAVLPDGRGHAPNNLAYIDASHLEAYSSDPGHPAGIDELTRMLMHIGYLPLLLGEMDHEHLQRAACCCRLLPARPFSADERTAVREFVDHGGLFVSMVGAEDVAASQPLLADFHLHVPPMPTPPWENVPETEPLGGFMQTFATAGEHKASVHFFAGWPVEGRKRAAAGHVGRQPTPVADRAQPAKWGGLGCAYWRHLLWHE